MTCGVNESTGSSTGLAGSAGSVVHSMSHEQWTDDDLRHACALRRLNTLVARLEDAKWKGIWPLTVTDAAVLAALRDYAMWRPKWRVRRSGSGRTF